MKNIKAIETYYNGYRFRSRAEARWAVLLDSLRCLYIPEPEGVLLSDGTWYLPDFYLPESDSFLEVKGILDDIDLHKIQQLIKDSGKAVNIGYSDMTFQACDNYTGWGDGHDNFELTCDDSWICRCRTCGKVFFMGSFASYKCQCCGEYDGDHHFKILLDCYAEKDGTRHLSKCADGTSGFSALNKARQARFEHGEKP